MAEQSYFEELKNRKVVRAALIYLAVAWGLTEGLVLIVDQLFLPQWVATLTVILFVVGFPIAMFLAWTFDVTPEGIQRTVVTSRRGKASIALSMILLLAGTTGLFFLIKPSLNDRAPSGLAAAGSPNSIAVLPFDYSGSNPNDSYLGPGLSDELRDQLGRVEGLRMAARSSSMAAAEMIADARSRARQLGVATLLEGSMRRRGNILRVSVELVDGTTGLAIWSDSFDRDRRELLNIQQEIATAVVQKLLPGADQPIAEPATQNATANELMWLGRRYEQQALEREDVEFDSLQQAVLYYRRATEADPDSALARSRLAAALLYLGDLDEAEAQASAALLKNPNLAEVQYAFWKVLFARGSPDMGVPLARAVDLNPNLPDALNDYAFWHWFNESTDGVAELYRRALQLDPLNPARYGALGHFLALYEQFDEVRALIEQMQGLFDGATAFRAIAKLYDLMGDVDHAIAWAIKARDAEPGNLRHVEQLAEYYTDIGDYDTAALLEPDLGVGLLFKMRRYDEMIDKAEYLMFDYPEDFRLRTYLGYAYNAKGRFEDAERIITTSGLMNSYSHTRRNSEETDAFSVLLDAVYGRGAIDRAREMTEWRLATHYESDNTSYWWIAFETACKQAILGDDNEVYRLLQRTQTSNTLPWEPMLKDHVCFKRFADDPVYLATVEHFDDLRAQLRARLPATLAHYGVAL